MKPLDNVLCGLTLLAALLVAAGPARAGVGARVVTVGDIANGPHNATMWGFAQQYLPPESRDKPSGQLTDAEKLAITKRVFALQLYMNALATDAGQGRPLTDRDLIYKGEKLYLPPQDVIDKLVELMPDDATTHIPAAKYDIAMHTVLRDVADNKDVIAQSKAGSNLTTTVLADAEQVKQADARSDSNLGGQTGPGGVQSMLANVPRDQELPDESTPTEAVVLGPDGQPLSPEGQTVSPADSPFATLLGDLTKIHTTVLQAQLGTIEQGAQTPGPNQAMFADLERRVKAELARRDAANKAQSGNDTGATTRTASAAATKNTTHPAAKPSADTAANELGPETEPVDMEVVPDWYLKSMQEWNLSRYWASKSNAAKGHGSGRRKLYDPLTGKEKEEEDTSNPFGEFTDELTNYTHDQGQVQKSPVGPK